ncbi:FxSxx-COOH system tetratricopeptide repeat protein [Streptomyces sp. AcE210]|uniref:FxSxx-COOH system tetratricopeptide repeat protein n=1 Tax=Streptomyces sp. AcE210 TaxID=2292703 RepID=UPI000E30B1A2|nr:FxSxx-COOH system tetratricopeptide repeat protein [Streptomyces sp. AcE210]RFC76397.1 tetratricopeptide repeat protein [Streptomyces sp. AcE210]
MVAWLGPALVVAVAVGAGAWAGLRYGLEKANSLAGVVGGVTALIGAPAAVFGLRALRAAVGTGPSGAGTGAGSGAAPGSDHLSLQPPVLQAPVRGRDRELAEVQAMLKGRHKGGMAVVCGGGGLGKTTLAAETARRAAEAGTAVFWLQWRDDPTRLAEDLTLVARTLGLPNSLLDASRTGQAVLVDTIWAHLAATGGWLIVVDNVDTPDRIGPGNDPISDGRGWLRPDGAGLLVVTSRDTSHATWGTRTSLIRLAPLPDDAAATVLCDTAPNAGSTDDARALGARLGGLPLALDAVGTYLALPTSRYRTFTGYQHALDREFGDLIGASHPQAADPDVARTIIRHTWDLSLDQLADDGYTLARPTLHLLALLTPAPVPRTLLTPDLLATVTGETSTGAGLDSALAGLHQYGLITTNTTLTGSGAEASGTTGTAALTTPYLLLHPLVRDVMTHALRQAVGDISPWYEALDSRLIEAATDAAGAGRAGWPTARLLAPHLAHLLDRATATDFMSRRDTLEQLSATLRGAGAGLEEHVLRESVLAAELERLGPEDRDIFSSRNNLAGALTALGRYREALDLHQQNLTYRERSLGPEHPDTVRSRGNLANALGDLGRHQEAADLHQQNLTYREQSLGPEHPQTLISRNNLATALGDLGRHQEAADLHQQNLTYREQSLGPEHPQTLISRNNLAAALSHLGRHQEAMAFLQQNLTGQERTLGPEHPQSLASRNNLATALGALGRRQEALALHEQTLNDQERTLGPEHPQTLASRNNLAAALSHLGRHQEAMAFLQQNLTGQERTLGPEHPDTLTSRNNLANTLGALGRHQEAVALLQQTLNDRVRILGPEHPDTFTSLNNLATAQAAIRASAMRGQRRQFWRRGRL